MLFRSDNINFIIARGNSEERARIHFESIRKEIKAGAIPQLAQKNFDLIKSSGIGLFAIPAVNLLVRKAYDFLIQNYLKKRMPNEDRINMELLAQISGIDPKDAFRAYYQPDGLMLLAKYSVMKYILKPEYLQVLPGCSSALVPKERTRSGNLLVARNLDYPIVNSWEKFPTLISHEPTEKGLIPYVAVTSAGVHSGGITGVNREGITLATHSHFSKDYSLKGRAIFGIGDEIISKAKCLNDAIEIVSKIQPMGSWAIVLGSAKENKGLVIEMTANKKSYRFSDQNVLTHTNYFQSEDMKGLESNVSNSSTEDMVARNLRMQSLLKDKRNISEYDLMDMLSDNYDCVNKCNRVVGNIISNIVTVQSVVIEPATQKLWISNKTTSPTSDGSFIPVDLASMRPISKSNKFQIKEHRSEKDPMDDFRDVYSCYKLSPDLALDRLEELLERDSSDSNLVFLAGVLGFKSERLDTSYQFFHRVYNERTLGQHQKNVVRLFLARIYDLYGQRDDAIKFYRLGLDNSDDERLRNALSDGLRTSYRREKIKGIFIDLQFPDALEY